MQIIATFLVALSLAFPRLAARLNPHRATVIRVAAPEPVQASLVALQDALARAFPRLAPHFAEHPDVVGEIHHAALEAGLEPALLAAVCVQESGAGSSRRAHRLCGVLRVERERQARAAAAILSRCWRACRSWPGALRMFNSGACDREATPGYAASVLRLRQRIETLMPDLVCAH